MKLKHWFKQGPADGGEGGGTGGGAGGGAGGGETVDRGDDWTPTEGDAPETPAKADVVADADAAKLEKEVADAKATKEAADDAAKEKPADEAKTDEAKPDGKADTRVPLSRHKQVLEAERMRREAVEAELAQYKQGGKIADINAEVTAAEDDILKLEKEHAKLLADGEHEKAAQVMTTIRRTERAINQKTAELREEAAEARAVERVRYETTVERVEEQYPMLNVDHADFDKAKTGEVLELKDAFQLKGYTPSAALQKAVRLIMPPATKKQEEVLDVTPRVDAKAVEAARKAAAAAATADAIEKTPANTAKVGKESTAAGGSAVTAKDAIRMPYKDFAALDEETLGRMRGDIL